MEQKTGIIVPSYNQGEYLEQAIKSVLKNKRYIDIQLVVMDGGSTDNSIEIIRKYQNEIDYWQSKPDGGQAAAINAGVKQLINCKYVMWLNSDDVYESEDAVSKIVSYAEKAKCAMCYGKSKLIDSKGNVIEDYPTERFNLDRLLQTCFISQPSVLVRKDVWDKEKGLDESLKMCLDYELWLRIAMNNIPVFYSEYIGNTRIYGETKTATMQKQHLAEAISIVSKMFGDVSLNWIYAQFLYNHSSAVMKKIPIIALKPYLYMVKKSYIKKAERISNYKSDIIRGN